MVHGQNGIYTVSQGIGLGIRQHNDVMIAFGYSRKVTKRITLQAGEYACITLTIPDGLNHHAEYRNVSVYNSPCDVAIVPNYLGTLPAVVEQLTAWDQRGATIDVNVKSVFEYRGTQTTNPIDITPDETNAIDSGTLRATESQGVRSASSETEEAIKGRYYYSGTHVVWVHNIGTTPAYIQYEYGWHEFE